MVRAEGVARVSAEGASTRHRLLDGATALVAVSESFAETYWAAGHPRTIAVPTAVRGGRATGASGGTPFGTAIVRGWPAAQ
jgi:hypothetical protein